MFLGAILLLYLLWNPASLKNISVRDVIAWNSRQESLELSDVLLPEAIVYTPGDGRYFVETAAVDEGYSCAEELIRRCFSGESVQIDEVIESGYNMMLRSFRTAYLDTNWGLSFSRYLSYLGCYTSTATNNIGSFRQIAFSQADETAIFVAAQDGRYYRIQGNLTGGSAEELALCLSSYRNDDVAYEASTILGGSSDIKLSLSPALSPAEKIVSRDYDEQQIARRLFGSTFDFVRRFSDSFGNISYMYGYGEKSLYLSSDGSLEYSQSIDEDLSELEYLTEILEIIGLVGKPEGELRLALGQSKGNAESYCFRQYIDGLPVNCPEEYIISCKIENSMLSVSFSDMYSIEMDAYEEGAEIADPANLIASDCNYMYNILSGSILSANSDEAFSYIIEVLDGAEICYFMDGDRLVPAWKLSAEDYSFYFNMYTSEPVGTEKQ